MPTERTLFRAAVAIAGLAPVGAGLAGVILGAPAFEAISRTPPDLSLDSHVRYLSGLLLGIGLAAWSTLKHPEDHGVLWRALASIVFLGGLARLGGLGLAGQPDLPMRLALGMELVVTPALALWREGLAARVSRG